MDNVKHISLYIIAALVVLGGAVTCHRVTLKQAVIAEGTRLNALAAAREDSIINEERTKALAQAVARTDTIVQTLTRTIVQTKTIIQKADTTIPDEVLAKYPVIIEMKLTMARMASEADSVVKLFDLERAAYRAKILGDSILLADRRMIHLADRDTIAQVRAESARKVSKTRAVLGTLGGVGVGIVACVLLPACE
jgi:hypothetical protein